MSRELDGPAKLSEPVHYLSVLTELLDLRSRAQHGQPFRLLLGSERFEEMVAYKDGYVRCAWRNGVDDLEYAAFRDWLRDIRGEFPNDWVRSYVDICGGDHERAMMRLLDFVAEYVALRQRTSPPENPELQVPPPTFFSPPERYVSVLEELRHIHSNTQRGFPFWLALGTETLPALSTFIRGYLRCAERHGITDMRWLAFSQWLVDTHHLATDSWEVSLLQRSNDDHIQAMRHLLDFVITYGHHEGPP
jgi:hypothetical protein